MGNKNMTTVDQMSYDDTLSYLRNLLHVKYLTNKAKQDVKVMLELHSSGQYRLNKYYSVALIYPFLINPESPSGVLLRSMLRGYSGDLLHLINDRESWYGYDDYERSGLSYPFEMNSIFLSAKYLGRKLRSGDLLTSLILCPIDPDLYPAEADTDQQVYSYIRREADLRYFPHLKIFSEMADFLDGRKIVLSDLISKLTGIDEISDDPEGICQRYSIALGIDNSGLIKVKVIERWGRHDITEEHGFMPAPHGLWFPDTALFLPDEIAEFENLINSSPPVPEEAYQEFFENNPKWLYLIGEQYEDFAPQIRLPPVQLHSELGLVTGKVDEMWLKPDFMLKRIDLDLWDVLDIKSSDVRLVVGPKSRRKFSEAVAIAVAQLREYVYRLRQNETRLFIKSKYGLTISEPVAMVVIGRDFDFKTVRDKSILGTSGEVRIYTYDDLFRLAKHRKILF
jgi:hypothetical protein